MGVRVCVCVCVCWGRGGEIGITGPHFFPRMHDLGRNGVREALHHEANPGQPVAGHDPVRVSEKGARLRGVAGLQGHAHLPPHGAQVARGGARGQRRAIALLVDGEEPKGKGLVGALGERGWGGSKGGKQGGEIVTCSELRGKKGDKVLEGRVLPRLCGFCGALAANEAHEHANGGGRH